MTRTRLQRESWVAVAARTAVGAAVLLGPVGPAFGQAHGLEGVWGVTTQERDCVTNVPRGAPTRALVTYHKGGTVDENRHVPVFAVGQLSNGHGNWVHDGHATFVSRVASMVNFDTPLPAPPGVPTFVAGWQIATQITTMTGPDSFTTVGTSQFYNLNRELVRVGCASRVGERFK
jgi:hypothetical protein